MRSVWVMSPGVWSSIWLAVVYLQSCFSAEFTLEMDSEASCIKTHYYEKGDVFTASTNGNVHGGTCPLTFMQGTAWTTDQEAEPCLSLCIRILSYTMESCYVQMAYHDGLNDYTPVTFDCHTFPPVMWCSSNTDLKVSVTELKNYQEKNYAITLEVKPFCGKFDQKTTDAGVIATPQSKPPMNQAVVIIGAVVGTISILFVCGWLLYCYKKRQGERDSNTSRSTQGQSSNQQATRYAPVERNPPSSQSSCDRAPLRQPPENIQQPNNHPNFAQESRPPAYSPFQPPAMTKNPYYPGAPPPFYSDIDRGPGGGKAWYPMTQLGPSQGEPDPPVKFSLPNDPGMPYNPQQVYKYPQFNQDSEMHTAPTDTRYVVYDFDYSRPMERTYSVGKSRPSPHRDSPVKDISNQQRPREITPPTDFIQRPREITPLRETVRVMHPDTTTTDHTSDNESSYTDSSDYATDDQFIPTRPYRITPPYALQDKAGQRQNDTTVRYYDPSNFQRIDSARGLMQGKNPEPSGFQRINGYGQSERANISDISPDSFRENVYSSSPPKPISPLSTQDFVSPSKNGPVPQVPPLPKAFIRPQSSSRTPTPMQPTPMHISPRNHASQAQDRQVPYTQRKGSGSGPQIVPPVQEAVSSGSQVVPPGLSGSQSQPSQARSDSRPHNDSQERDAPWPQEGPPPYSEEQAHLE